MKLWFRRGFTAERQLGRRRMEGSREKRTKQQPRKVPPLPSGWSRLTFLLFSSRCLGGFCPLARCAKRLDRSQGDRIDPFGFPLGILGVWMRRAKRNIVPSGDSSPSGGGTGHMHILCLYRVVSRLVSLKTSPKLRALKKTSPYTSLCYSRLEAFSSLCLEL